MENAGKGRILKASEADTSDTVKVSRDAMLRAIGVDPSVIKWPDPPLSIDELEPRADDSEFKALNDSEWDLICPLLPAEAAQANTMRNRAFIDAVLTAQARGAWINHRDRNSYSDAIRRRFGRWAEQGIWQQLFSELSKVALSTKRLAEFKALTQRACTMKRR